jgi:hypothetical protein
MVRAMTNVRLGGVATVCCIHHVEKRRYVNLVYDSRVERPAECICCENVFAYSIRLNGAEPPLFCSKCTMVIGKVVSHGRS